MPWRGVASRGPHLGYSAAKVRHLLWTFGKWYFPHVTHFRFLGWVLGRFPEIMYPVNVQHCCHSSVTPGIFPMLINRFYFPPGALQLDTPPQAVAFDREFRTVRSRSVLDSAPSTHSTSSAPASPAEERRRRPPGLLRTPSEVPVVRARHARSPVGGDRRRGARSRRVLTCS